MEREDKISGKKVIKVNNLSETRAELAIYGVIGENFWGDAVSANDVNDALVGLSETVNQLDVRLNSPGGDVFDGVAIYHRLKQFKGNTTIYIDGLAASIASIIALAGDEVKIGEGSLMMVHKPWTFAIGNENDLQNQINLLNDIEDSMVGIYRRRTKLESNQIRKMLAEETWFDAQQALEFGFATEVIGEDEEVEMAAYLQQGKAFMKKMPQNARSAQDAMKKSINDIVNKVKSQSSSPVSAAK